MNLVEAFQSLISNVFYGTVELEFWQTQLIQMFSLGLCGFLVIKVFCWVFKCLGLIVNK